MEQCLLSARLAAVGCSLPWWLLHGTDWHCLDLAVTVVLRKQACTTATAMA
jgi:hypothetical protein